MEDRFYSTGQVGHQLGLTQAAVRKLCENGLIAAEMTPGGQWRVPLAEVERFKREGVPPIPRTLPVALRPAATNGAVVRYAHSGLPAKPSAEVVSAEDSVAITRSILERRKIERELEELEDWCREHQRQRAATEAAERQKAEAQVAELLYRRWTQKWQKCALDSVPDAARGEVEIEVHAEVEAVLSRFPTCQPEAITKPLVNAAVKRALRPWLRKQEILMALESTMKKLPWDIQNSSDYAALKKRAWDAAVEALHKVRDEAVYREIETATVQAVEPMIREYDHQQACRRVVRGVYIFKATDEEREAAEEAVRKALAQLPIGAAPKELRRAEETALAPYQAAIAQRIEKARVDAEMEDRRSRAEWKVDRELDHISRYLAKEYSFRGGNAEMRRAAERLRPAIRTAVVKELLENPEMTTDEIRNAVEDRIDDEV
jgi:excisionase family DNA binding protein